MEARIRLIDANKLQTTTTYFGISDTPVEVVKKSVIDNAKTVEAIPMSVIEKITAEIQKKIDENLDSEGIPNEYAYCYESVLDIIDKAVKEISNEST